MDIENTYKCNNCIKIYKTKSGLWKHEHICNKKDKKDKPDKINKPDKIDKKDKPDKIDNPRKIDKPGKIDNPDKIDKSDKIEKSNIDFNCEFCLKKFTTNHNKNRHQSNCQFKNTITELKNDFNIKIESLKKDIENKSNKKVYNKFINSGIINSNKIIINKSGNESLELTNDEVRQIFNKEVEGLLTFIEFANFNERLPNNHSFCSTSLDSKYVSKYNVEEKIIQKDRKKYYFDQVINKAIDNLDYLYTKFKKIFLLSQQKQIEEKINNIKNIKSYDYNNKFIKELINQLNLLSYNKKDIVINTWNQLYYDSDSDSAENFEDDLNKGVKRKILLNENKNLMNIHNLDVLNVLDSLADSDDSDNTDDNIYDDTSNDANTNDDNTNINKCINI